MKISLKCAAFMGACAFSIAGTARSQSAGTATEVPLAVPAGTPLRVYVTNRFSKQVGAPVSAKVLEPVYAFDREVIPAGAVVTGRVSRTVPVNGWTRISAMLNGDFTPLRASRVEFTSLTLPDGRRLDMRTVETSGLNTIYIEPKPGKARKRTAKPQVAPTRKGQLIDKAKQAAKDKINSEINARSRGIADIVRYPNRKERLFEMAMAKLPYHPQYVRRGTRFDVELKDGLSFGSETIDSKGAEKLGTQPAPDSVVRARLLTPLDSGSAKQGEAVEAVLAQPLFSADHKLVLPEGAMLKGTVVMTRRARLFHRGGQLRFNFQNLEMPPEVANLRFVAPRPEVPTQAQLEDAEGAGRTPVLVDSEGGVKATESKTRLLAPLASVIIASRAADNDAGRAGGGGGNVSGRTLGGGSGFGLLGMAASQSSKYVGMALGYYGMAWSVYNNVIARGAEVRFDKNAMIDIKFGARPAGRASGAQRGGGAK